MAVRRLGIFGRANEGPQPGKRPGGAIGVDQSSFDHMSNFSSFRGCVSASFAVLPAFQRGLSALLLAAAFIALGPQARADDSGLLGLLEQGNPLIDIRARYEGVDDKSKAFYADAYTTRARLGYETPAYVGFRLLAEMDAILDLNAQFNSTRNGKSIYPTVADPEMAALNRLQLSYVSDYDTNLIVGRQRILLGDQRFVGNAGWRQHEQTFDAVSVTNTSLPGLTTSYAYLDRVNRVYGPSAPVPAAGPTGAFHCDCHIFDLTYSGISDLKIEGFGLLLNIAQDNGPKLTKLTTSKLSTETFGARGEYKTSFVFGITGDVIGTYAHQSNYRDNPVSADLNYWRGEGSLGFAGVTATVGYEGMEGNGKLGFSTPLATTHLYDGWADMFLNTPANGLGNFYVKGSYSAAPLAETLHIVSVTATVVHRDFATNLTNDSPDHGLGTEWDEALEFGITKSASVLLQFSDYNGAGLAYGGFKDKSISWVQLAYKY